MPPPFDSHQQQVRRVGTGDQQHQADRSHQHPQYFSDVPHHVLLQRPQVRRKLRVVEELYRESRRRRKTAIHDRHHARDVRAGLPHGHARPQPRHSLVTEIPQNPFRAIELKRRHQLHVVIIHELHILRQHADDLRRRSIQRNRFPNRRGRPAEFVLPVSVSQQNRRRFSRQIVLVADRPPQHRRDSQ